MHSFKFNLFYLHFFHFLSDTCVFYSIFNSHWLICIWTLGFIVNEGLSESELYIKVNAGYLANNLPSRVWLTRVSRSDSVYLFILLSQPTLGFSYKTILLFPFPSVSPHSLISIFFLYLNWPRARTHAHALLSTPVAITSPYLTALPSPSCHFLSSPAPPRPPAPPSSHLPRPAASPPSLVLFINLLGCYSPCLARLMKAGCRWGRRSSL